MAVPSHTTDPAALARKNARMAAGVGTFVVAMALFAVFAVPPAYRLFCQVTGWGGTTQRVEANAQRVIDRKITVRFDANQAKDLPWTFKPEQVSQTMQVGQTMLAFYESTNPTGEPIGGQATYNVSPAKAGAYFKKIDCFCFTEQVLQPGEKASMPVAYFIDPAIDDDPNLDEVETVTLSYTFYRLDTISPSDTEASAASAPGESD
ncbi:MAG: cytochrome c oxidase assembly protein [Pseudomonadota bacterium]